jgi:hypothetical protein
MILNRRHINKVTKEIKNALHVGCDWALSKDGVVVKPEDIQYKAGNIGLLYPDRVNYNLRSLYETLRQIDHDKVPDYLQKAGVVESDRKLVNVGAMLKEKELKKRSLENKNQMVKKATPRLSAGRRK